MTNAFVAVLLKMAAEERLRAVAARSMVQGPAPGVDGVPWYVSMCERLDREFDNTAQEAEARAEVYDRFAWRLISDLAGDHILAQFEELTGAAELLEADRPFEFPEPVYTPPWQVGYWYRIYPPLDDRPFQFLGGV